MMNFNELITRTVIVHLENDEYYYNEIKEFLEENEKDSFDEFVTYPLILDMIDFQENPLLYDIAETALSYVDWNEVASRWEED